MKRRAIFVLAAALLTQPAVAHPAPPGQSAEATQIVQEVVAFREEMKKAIEAKDVNRLREMYVDSFTHTHGSGKMDGKDARILSLLAADPTIEMAPVEEPIYRVLTTDTVVLTAKSPILVKSEGKEYPFRWIQVFVRERGQWKLAASQATRLPLPS
jgi:hypothetical protein